jgi:hypothetical protein
VWAAGAGAVPGASEEEEEEEEEEMLEEKVRPSPRCVSLFVYVFALSI